MGRGNAPNGGMWPSCDVAAITSRKKTNVYVFTEDSHKRVNVKIMLFYPEM